MNPHRRQQFVVLLGIVGMGAFLSLWGISQLQSRIYFPIDQDTLVLTKALTHDALEPSE